MFSIEHLNALRAVEIETIVSHLQPPGAHVLEVGAGTGRQAQELAARGYSVEAIEIPDSNYSGHRLFPITDYDGRHIPFADQSFDIVFSSNVLEHVPDLTQLHAEIRRVLKPGGYAIHVMPTHVWRFWTTLSQIPTGFQNAASLGRRLLTVPYPSRIKGLVGAWRLAARHIAVGFYQRRHGERGNTISEIWLFHPGWWRRNFAMNGFDIVTDDQMGLFYTGSMLLGPGWSIGSRARAAQWLGSACHLFKVKPRR